MNHVSLWRRFLWVNAVDAVVIIGYGATNHLVAWQVAHGRSVREATFAFEARIPFVGWLLWPYLSALPLFSFIFLTLADRGALRRHTWRILAALGVGMVFFVACPLRTAWTRSVEAPWQGWFYALDPPHNLLPSLHVAFAVLGIYAIAKYWPSPWRWVGMIWYAAIIPATVFTHQHHVADVLAGAALGLILLCIIPELRTVKEVPDEGI